MSKMSIDWHRQCLANHQVYIQTERERVQRALQRLENSEAEFMFASEQLAEAERRGLDGYDADKFMKKRTA